MKIAFLLSLMLVVLLVGCGGGFHQKSTHLGTLYITSNYNDADIYINGKFFGTANTSNQLEITISAEKEHYLEAKKERCRDYEITFSLEPNEKRKIDVILESL